MLWIKKDSNTIHIIVWSIAIIVIGVLASKYIPESKIAKENIRQHEVIQIMAKIDDIAHRNDKILHDIGSGYNEKRDRAFHVADNAYHKAQYRDEKYAAAIALNELIKEQNGFLHTLIGENPFAKEANQQFEDLQKQIEKFETQ